MKISAFDVRVGGLIEYNGKLWRILKKSHVKPGKGGAFVQLEMKELSAGTKLNERFRSEDKVEKPHVEVRDMQYLYLDGDNDVFMDSSTYEQIGIPAEDLEEQIKYLLPNTEVIVAAWSPRFSSVRPSSSGSTTDAARSCAARSSRSSSRPRPTRARRCDRR